MAVIDQVVCDEYAIYNGDSCEVLKSFPDASIDLCIFSPPFSSLYCYSDAPEDIGNCVTHEEFFEHFGHVIRELVRVIRPGRICAVHCMDLPTSKEHDGVIGMYDFSGDLIRAFCSAGFVYHSPRITIWKDPLIAAVRTKALGLLHKQLCKDSCVCRTGVPDYVICFRAPGDNVVPVEHNEGLTSYSGSQDPGGNGVKRSHMIWRAYASPVWMDIRQTRILDARPGREEKDEKHLCPLRLDVIDRLCVLFSNPGETVMTPFMGVGSECYGAVVCGRRAVGIELKPSYYAQSVANMKRAMTDRKEEGLF